MDTSPALIDSHKGGWRHLAAALNGLASILQWSGALILAVLLVLVLTSVTLRYVFGSGFIWSEELAIWLNVLLVAVGAPLAVTGPLAMRLDVVVQFMPFSLQKIARVIADGIAVDAGIILALGGAHVVAAIGGTSTVLGLPEWLRYAAFAAGGGLMVVMLVGRIVVEDGLARALLVLAVGVGLYLAAHHLIAFPMATPSLAAGIAAAVGLVLGAPLPHALLVGVSLATPFGALLPEPAVVQNTVVGVSKFLLLAIPTRASRRAARSRSRIVGRAPDEPIVLPRHAEDLDDEYVTIVRSGPAEAPADASSVDAPPQDGQDSAADLDPDARDESTVGTPDLGESGASDEQFTRRPEEDAR